MKYIKSLLAAASMMIFTGAALTSCSEDLETPPLSIPSSDWEANTTIADLKATYWNDQENYCTQVGTTPTGEHVIIGGRVIGNDITGNIYQAIQLQDSTGAVTVSVAMKDMNLRYKVGEQVFIDVTDLYAGKYAGLFQIGTAGTYNNAPTTSKMSEEEFTSHSQLNGLPRPSEVSAKKLTIAEINAMAANTADVMLYQSQLITIDDVSFVGGGSLRWADAGSSGSDRYLIDKEGNRLLVRNSGYSDFCDQILPAGHGNITAILSWYRTGWQVVFRTNEDCTDFGGESYAPGSGEAVVSSLDQTFEGCTSITDLGNWTTADTDGKATWFTQTYSGNTFAACTGYNKTPGSAGYDSWLITPGLDLDKMAEKVMSFESMVGYTGNGTLEVYALTSNDPSSATLTKLDATIPQPSGSWSEWIKSGNIDLSAFSGIIYIGFRYQAAVSAANTYTTYRIDNIVAGKKAEEGDTPTPPASGTTFVKASSITSGSQYVFVVDSQVGSPFNQTYQYGRFALSAVTITDNELTTAETNAVTITKNGEYYTIVDTYGRYLGVKPGYETTFQVYTSVSNDCLWTIDFDSDGKAVITSVGSPIARVLQQGTFTNVAPAKYQTITDAFTYPTLYVKK